MIPLLLTLACTPGPVDGEGEPRLVLDRVPELSSHSLVHGKVSHVWPEDHQVAPYVYLGPAEGWWSRPPVGIRRSGAFSADTTVEEGDDQAQIIAAFLWDAASDPPTLEGDLELPAELTDPAPPHDARHRHDTGTDRLIWFSGRDWSVRSSTEEQRPGPSLWSDSQDSVWVDADGRLHLALVEEEGQAWAAEVSLRESLGLGTYVFSLDSPVRQPNEFVVAGLFARDVLTERENKEFDIELARWADPDGHDAQYVLAPWELAGNGDVFTVGPLYEPTVHACEWQEDRHLFTSAVGRAWPPAAEDLLHTWEYDGPSVMVPDNEQVRINLWLFRYLEPPASAAHDVELVLSRFDFLPPEAR